MEHTDGNLEENRKENEKEHKDLKEGLEENENDNLSISETKEMDIQSKDEEQNEDAVDNKKSKVFSDTLVTGLMKNLNQKVSHKLDTDAQNELVDIIKQKVNEEHNECEEEKPVSFDIGPSQQHIGSFANKNRVELPKNRRLPSKLFTQEDFENILSDNGIEESDVDFEKLLVDNSNESKPDDDIFDKLFGAISDENSTNVSKTTKDEPDFSSLDDDFNSLLVENDISNNDDQELIDNISDITTVDENIFKNKNNENTDVEITLSTRDEAPSTESSDENCKNVLKTTEEEVDNLSLDDEFNSLLIENDISNHDDQKLEDILNLSKASEQILKNEKNEKTSLENTKSTQDEATLIETISEEDSQNISSATKGGIDSSSIDDSFSSLLVAIDISNNDVEELVDVSDSSLVGEYVTLNEKNDNSGVKNILSSEDKVQVTSEVELITDNTEKCDGGIMSSVPSLTGNDLENISHQPSDYLSDDDESSTDKCTDDRKDDISFKELETSTNVLPNDTTSMTIDSDVNENLLIEHNPLNCLDPVEKDPFDELFEELDGEEVKEIVDEFDMVIKKDDIEMLSSKNVAKEDEKEDPFEKLYEELDGITETDIDKGFQQIFAAESKSDSSALHDDMSHSDNEMDDLIEPPFQSNQTETILNEAIINDDMHSNTLMKKEVAGDKPNNSDFDNASDGEVYDAHTNKNTLKEPKSLHENSYSEKMVLTAELANLKEEMEKMKLEYEHQRSLLNGINAKNISNETNVNSQREKYADENNTNEKDSFTAIKEKDELLLQIAQLSQKVETQDSLLAELREDNVVLRSQNKHLIDTLDYDSMKTTVGGCESPLFDEMAWEDPTDIRRRVALLEMELEDQRDVNKQLKSYVGDVLINIMLKNPQILEKKH